MYLGSVSYTHLLAQLSVETGELIVYGYLPMMVSAQCVHKTLEGCDRKRKSLRLHDRYSKDFFIENICKYCYNLIYNSCPLSLLSLREEVMGLNPMSIRLNFTRETKEETGEILQSFVENYRNGKMEKEKFYRCV